MTFTWHCWQDYAHADLVMMELSIMYQSVPVSGSWPSSNPLVTWNQLHFAVLSYSLNIYLQCPVTVISKYLSPTMVIAHCSCILTPNSGVATTYKMPDSTLCFSPRTSVHGVGDSAHMVVPHSALLYCRILNLKCLQFSIVLQGQLILSQPNIGFGQYLVKRWQVEIAPLSQNTGSPQTYRTLNGYIQPLVTDGLVELEKSLVQVEDLS